MIFALWRRACLIAAFLVLPIPASANSDADSLIELLRFEETVAIMRFEGQRYGVQVGQEMIPDVDPAAWAADVSRIYDTEKMLSLVSRDFREELGEADLTPVIAYFETPDGREIVERELVARRAFLDAGTEQEAMARFKEIETEHLALAAQIAQVIDDSDLIEFNVMGTLNSSLMFYRGLRDGGAYEATEDEIFADVWSQEEATRDGSAEWLGAFLMLAYEPLRPEQLDGYIEIYRTPAGRELNRAIFAAFDRMYEEISYLIGRAIAERMQSVPL